MVVSGRICQIQFCQSVFYFDLPIFSPSKINPNYGSQYLYLKVYYNLPVDVDNMKYAKNIPMNAIKLPKTIDILIR